MDELKLAPALERNPLAHPFSQEALQRNHQDLLDDAEALMNLQENPRRHPGMFFGGFILTLVGGILLISWNKFFNPSLLQITPLFLFLAGATSMIISDKFGKDAEEIRRIRRRIEADIAEPDLEEEIGLAQNLAGAGAAAGVVSESSNDKITRHLDLLTERQRMDIALALDYSEEKLSGTKIAIEDQLNSLDLRAIGANSIIKLLNHIFASQNQESEGDKKILRDESIAKFDIDRTENLSGEIKQLSAKEFSQITGGKFEGNPIKNLLDQVYYYSCFYNAVKSQLRGADLEIIKETFQKYFSKALPKDKIIQDKITNIFSEKILDSEELPLASHEESSPNTHLSDPYGAGLRRRKKSDEKNSSTTI